MLISFKCPACNNRMYEDQSATGKLRQCPRCRHCVQVPMVKPERRFSLRWLIAILLLCVIAGASYWIYYYLETHS